MKINDEIKSKLNLIIILQYFPNRIDFSKMRTSEDPDDKNII